MKHIEVKHLQLELNALINHCVEKKVAIFHVNYGLDRNMTKINAAVEEINKHVSQELKDLEKKVYDLAKEKDKENDFDFGLKLLTKKEKARRDELMAEYNKAMAEENDLELYLLDIGKIEGLTIEFPFYQILKKFLPKE